MRLHLVVSQTLRQGTLQRVQASNLKALCLLLPELGVLSGQQMAKL